MLHVIVAVYAFKIVLILLAGNDMTDTRRNGPCHLSAPNSTTVSYPSVETSLCHDTRSLSGTCADHPQPELGNDDLQTSAFLVTASRLNPSL